MRTSRAWAWFIAALAAATVQALSAQGMCSALTDSIETCWHKYVPNDQEAAVQQAERRARTGADIANSVLDLVTSTSVVGADTASTVSNFLPLLALTGFGGDLGGTRAFRILLFRVSAAHALNPAPEAATICGL